MKPLACRARAPVVVGGKRLAAQGGKALFHKREPEDYCGWSLVKYLLIGRARSTAFSSDNIPR